MIRNIYQCAKSCVSLNGHKSDYFMSNTGGRPGENFSPLIFFLYTNDLDDFVAHKYVKAVTVTMQLTLLLLLMMLNPYKQF